VSDLGLQYTRPGVRPTTRPISNDDFSIPDPVIAVDYQGLSTVHAGIFTNLTPTEASSRPVGAGRLDRIPGVLTSAVRT